MDLVKLNKIRVAPTVQQGGTQTMQQAIYLTHDNPCGANQLIFQKMGLIGIRFIDLKNYMDEILASQEMLDLFEEVKIAGTEYINNPVEEFYYYKYRYALMIWAKTAIDHFPVPEDYYPGYRLKFSLYDGDGDAIFDSFFPELLIMRKISVPPYYTPTYVPLDWNPYFQMNITLYKMLSYKNLLPYVHRSDPNRGVEIISSDFILCQTQFPESVMAEASLLVDTANARAFGIPTYGFSARSNQHLNGGIGYYCAHVIQIRTTPDADGNTTLIESIFVRLSVEENTI